MPIEVILLSLFPPLQVTSIHGALLLRTGNSNFDKICRTNRRHQYVHNY